jgi:Flp pilus assembly protein TadG
MRRTITKRTPRTCERFNDMTECHDIICYQTKTSSKHLRRRGIAFVWTALVIMTIFLLVGLSIDWAKLLYNVHELQNAADAAALAGAQIVKDASADATRQWTHDLAYANTAEKLKVTLRTTVQADPFVDNPDLDIILGRWINNQHYFFETLETPDAVKVIARRADGLTDAPPLAFLFGPLVDVDTANARCTAIGWYNMAGGAGLIVLDETPVDENGNKIPGLLIADSVGNIQVFNGSIHVNTVWEGTKWNNDPPAALCVKAGGNMLCGRLTIAGYTDPVPPTEDNLNGWDNIWEDTDLGIQMPYDISEGAGYMPDPLRDIEPPDWHDYEVKSYTKNTSTTLDPGYYPDGIEMTKDGTVVNLNPGTYILGGGTGSQCSGLIINGGQLIAHGVLIYLTKDYVDSNGKWAQLDIAGNVITDITPPGDEVDPKIINGIDGVSIWQDRANTENQAELNGEQGLNVSGTLYFPNNHVYLAGNPGKTGNQILCGSLEVFGKAQIVVEYDGRNNQSIGVSVLVK